MKYFYLLIFTISLFSSRVLSQTSGCPQITSSTQHFCLDTQPTVSDLLPQSAVWYSSSNSTIPLSPSTALVSSQFYYADNIDGTCGSRPRVRAYVYANIDAGSDNLGAICDSEVDEMFPALYSIENYYLSLLSPGVPRSGTFSPSASEMVTDYHSEPVVGYKDFPRTYTYGAAGCQDSAVITLRVYEDVKAGIDTEITLSSTGPPITMLDSLAGNPSAGGTWSGIETGIFDPAVDTAGVYVYTVESTLCGSGTATLTINVNQDGWSLPVAQYGSYIGFTTSNENYVITRSPRIKVSSMTEISNNDEIIESITYFDGLGRPLQEVAIRGGGNEEDIVTPFVYDSYGRQVQQYLPYASTSLRGQFHPNAVNNAGSFYNTLKYEQTLNPYSEKELEASPLNRVYKQAAPGNDWKLGGGHEIEFAYQTNSLNEVRMFRVTFDNDDPKDPLLDLGQTEFYASGQLYKFITRDENHSGAKKNHTTEEFKDKQGRVVLKRTYADVKNNTEVNHDTYYVYDDYGNLTFVLPPKLDATESTIIDLRTALNKLGYQYRYDHRNRLIEKKIPGKGWEYIIYNGLNQPVMTQDQLQRDKTPQEWLYTKYDAFGRVVSTGIFTNTLIGTGRESMQENLNNYYSTTADKVYEARNGNSYTNTSFPSQNIELLTENFYDDYSFDKVGIVIPVSVFNGIVVEQQKVKGLPTGSRVKVLGTTHFITTVSGYDPKGKLIWTASKNPFLQTEDEVEYKLDFMGNIRETRSTHQKEGNGLVETRDMFTYDHQNRLISHTQTINEGHEALIAFNDYDELGQIFKKWVGGYFHIGDGPLQKIDYTYNIRGWLKRINNPSNLGDNLFGFEINYNDPKAGADALYNGNISETHWNTKSVNTTGNTVSTSYKYSYDALNRITGAIDNTGNYNLRNVSYDKMGNILSLQRQGQLNADATLFGNMDDLAYGYEIGSNKLVTVNDLGNGTFGFKDGSTAAVQYYYDPNGNLKSDLNKAIGTSTIPGIKYNHLNLPTEVMFNNSTNQVIKYTYDATGLKLKKEIPGKVTEYAGNLVYEKFGTGSNVLQFFNHPEGYVSYDGGQFNYVYNYKDHLGNIRLSYSDGNGNNIVEFGSTYSEIIQEKNYYPFGLTHKGYNIGGSPLGNDAAKRYGFGGKELQNESILGNYLDWYDISARNYDLALGRWMNIDPAADVLESSSPYVYALNSPIVYLDLDGELPILINGRVGSDSERGNESYWSSEIIATIKGSGIANPGGQIHYVDGDRGYKTSFYSAARGIRTDEKYALSAGSRYNAGYKAAAKDIENIIAVLERDPETGKITEKIQIYTHSRGAAFGAGYTNRLLKYIKENSVLFADANNVIDFVLNLAPHQSNFINSPDGVDAYSIDRGFDMASGDDMKGLKGAFKSNAEKGKFGESHRIKSFENDLKSFMDAFMEGKGDNSKLIKGFIRKMNAYGIKVTVTE